MDTTTLVRIIAGVLAVAVLAFLIYRRKSKSDFAIVPC
jgi:LPXTG-motif cell wall-anchored protein